eukprot:3166202-Alexandrium_andersonii.AAC.1
MLALAPILKEVPTLQPWLVPTQQFPPQTPPMSSPRLPCECAGRAFAELLEQRAPKFRSCLNKQLRHSEAA